MTSSPDLIDFARGYPDPSLLPVDLIRAAAQHAYLPQETSIERLQSWLAYPGDYGDDLFRQHLASFINTQYQVEDGQETSSNSTNNMITPDHLLITTGVSHGIELVCSLLIPPGSTVYVENPTYFFATPIFYQHGYRVLPIPTLSADPTRIDFARLSAECAITHPSLMYVIPAAQNPLGVTMNNEDRLQLIRLCEQHQFYVIVDEVYHLLTFPSTLPQRPLSFMQLTHIHARQRREAQKKADTDINAFVSPPSEKAAYLSGKPLSRSLFVPSVSSPRGAEHLVLSLSSFAKILCPGARVGWLHAHSSIVTLFSCNAAIRSGGCPAQLSVSIVDALLTNDKLMYREYIQQLRREYQHRCNVMCAAIDEFIADAQYHAPTGGFFLWLVLPISLDSTQILIEAKKEGVNYKPGTTCAVKDEPQLPVPPFPTYCEPPTAQLLSVFFNDKQQQQFSNCLRLCFSFYSASVIREGIRRLGVAVNAYRQQKT